MVDTRRGPATRPTIYEQIGVPSIINGRGATTAVGGSLMWPEVIEAMAQASQAFVEIDLLNRKVGEKIAEVMGTEAGYVTSGSAAGMALAAAACIAGRDAEKIRRLPDSQGMRNEIIIHRSHRLNYDQMYRAGGARLVEIGLPSETEPWELEAAINERTAAVAYHDSRSTGHGALDFQTVVEVAHSHGIPVIVDAASTVPPIDHLRRWARWGADLVIFSGGKGIRGPQDSGLLGGRADLIEAARMNGSPNAAVGRGMKVSKEAMAGLWKALDLFMSHDHTADYAAHLAQAETIWCGLAHRSDVRCELNADWEEWPAPVISLHPVGNRWNARRLRARLLERTPAIHANLERGALVFSTHCLLPGDAEEIVIRLNALLDEESADSEQYAG